MECGLSLGSNQGDRLAYLVEARRRLDALDGVTVTAASAVYETEPVDVSPAFGDQSFLNAVLIVEVSLAVTELTAAVHAIETAMGRVRVHDRNAPRPIDIDVLYAGDLRIDRPDLKVPHPRWSERRFVVEPLADVRPERVLPGATRTVSQLLAGQPETPRVAVFARAWE